MLLRLTMIPVILSEELYGKGDWRNSTGFTRRTFYLHLKEK